ncbi:hypothetical protein MNV84_00809 [Leishmania braziliensis]|nr:hypothetical protein MNV84_00809 [Leishmania braziliensis]CAJ2467435.1 unnamed protein product [Leishmania braziliensis]
MSLFSLPPDKTDPLPEPGDAEARRRTGSEDMESCCRLTAAEELRGHLLDCVSLYASRFEHSAVALACIGALFPSSLSSVQDDAPPDTLKVSEAEDGEPRSAGGAVDGSTVATVLFIHVEAGLGTCRGAAGEGDGEAATTLLGVVVAFQYWRGFSCVAERRYTSAAEAQDEAAALASMSLTVSEVLKMPQWQLIGERAAQESDHTDLSPIPRGSNMTRCLVGGEKTVAQYGAAYESLMALVVSTYL